VRIPPDTRVVHYLFHLELRGISQKIMKWPLCCLCQPFRSVLKWVVTVSAHLELWTPAGTQIVVLDQAQHTIGRAPQNDVALPDDPMVSWQHAILQSINGGWSVQDLGSRNGTLVRGVRLLNVQALRHGDDITIGRTKLMFRDTRQTDSGHTQVAVLPPELTRRERDVLHALCRPLFGGQVFREPATLREIAQALTVTEAAVQQHLLRLYTKFDIEPGRQNRRLALANEAIARGAVTIANLG
jgi:pSer/pThr/pTyr-binding forkhead associated (FHA) protein